MFQILLTIFGLLSLLRCSYISQKQIIFQKTDKLIKNSKTECPYLFILSFTKAFLQINCSQNNSQIYEFNTTLRQQLSSDSYIFELMPVNSSQIKLPMEMKVILVKAQLKIGLQWSYSLQFSNHHQQNFSLMDDIQMNKYKPVWIYLWYLGLSLIILPLGKVYYQYIDGITWYSLNISMQLSAWLMLNIITTFIIYLPLTKNSPTFLNIVSCFAIMLCLMVVIYHEKQKLNKLIRYIQGYRLPLLKKHLAVIGSLGVCIIGVILIFLSEKQVTTFVYFASGSIYYMGTFVLFKKMKKKSFSYRLILFDSISIGTIALISYYYPINRFWISSQYKLIGVYFLVGILVIGGGLLFILVNIVRKEIKQKKEKDARIKIKSTKNISQQENNKQFDIQINDKQTNQSLVNQSNTYLSQISTGKRNSQQRFTY